MPDRYQQVCMTHPKWVNIVKHFVQYLGNHWSNIVQSLHSDAPGADVHKGYLDWYSDSIGSADVMPMVFIVPPSGGVQCQKSMLSLSSMIQCL